MTRHRLLDDYFETDIQEYAPALKAVADALHEAQAGRAPAPVHGNVYSLTLTPSGATIANARDAKATPEHHSLDAFAHAFAAWRGRAKD